MDLDSSTQSERESLKWQGERWRVETWSYRRSGWRQGGDEPMIGEAVRETCQTTIQGEPAPSKAER